MSDNVISLSARMARPGFAPRNNDVVSIGAEKVLFNSSKGGTFYLQVPINKSVVYIAVTGRPSSGCLSPVLTGVFSVVAAAIGSAAMGYDTKGIVAAVTASSLLLLLLNCCGLSLDIRLFKSTRDCCAVEGVKRVGNNILAEALTGCLGYALVLSGGRSQIELDQAATACAIGGLILSPISMFFNCLGRCCSGQDSEDPAAQPLMQQV